MLLPCQVFGSSAPTLPQALAIALPAAAALLCVPDLVRHLGVSGFGVVAIALALLGYANVFELGLSRAVTFSISRRLARGDTQSSARLGTHALLLTAVFGAVGSLLTFLIAIPLLGSPSIVTAASATVVPPLIAASVPTVTVFSGCRGILEAHNAFPLSNSMRALVGVATYVAPWWVVSTWSLGLTGAIAALTLVRLTGAAVMLVGTTLCVGSLHIDVSKLKADFAELFSYGKWITLSNIVGPVMINMDRLIVGWILGVSAAGRYSAPQDLLSRASVFGSAFTGVVFPQLARLKERGLHRVADRVVLRISYLITYPAIAAFLILIVAIPTLLPLWIPILNDRDVIVTAQILAAGALWNTQAQVPAMVLHGSGRADLNAKLHLAEVVPFALIAVLCCGLFGIRGAAIAWAGRTGLDCLALILLTANVQVRRSTRVQMGVGLALGVVTAIVAIQLGPLEAILVSLVLLLGTYAVCTRSAALAAYGRLDDRLADTRQVGSESATMGPDSSSKHREGATLGNVRANGPSVSTPCF